MVEWLSRLIPFLKSSHVEETKLILTELKELKNEYKQEVKEQQRRIEDLETKVVELEKMEWQCLEQQRILMQQYHDLREKLIFKTKGKHKGDDI